MTARVLPFRRPPAAPRLTVSASEIVAADGYVLIHNPAGGEPHRIGAAAALVLAHHLETVAEAALAQLADRKRGKRR